MDRWLAIREPEDGPHAGERSTYSFWSSALLIEQRCRNDAFGEIVDALETCPGAPTLAQPAA